MPLFHDPLPAEIQPAELRQRFQEGEAPVVIDVREPHEFAGVRLKESRLIPMGELAGRAEELEPALEIVFVCRSGRRSGLVTEAFRRSGFSGARNLVGGLLAWPGAVEGSLAEGDWRDALAARALSGSEENGSSQKQGP